MQRQSLTMSQNQTDIQPVSEQMMANDTNLHYAACYCWTWHFMVWNIFLVSSGHLPGCVSLQTAHTNGSPRDRVRKRRPCHPAHCSARPKTLVLSTFSDVNLNQHWAAMQKINAIPAKSTTPFDRVKPQTVGSM